MKAYASLALGALAVLAGSQCSRAADFDQGRMEVQPDTGWHVIVSPYVWGASLNGKASIAGFNTDVDVPFLDTLKHLDLALMGNVEVTNGQWGAYIDAQYVRTSQDEEVFHHQIGLKITMTNIAGGVFYRAYERELGGTTVFGQPRRLALEPTVGLRWNQLKADVEAFGIRAKKDTDWTDPFVGLRMNADIDERWNVVAETDAGGFDIGSGSKLSVNAQAYLGYRTFVFNQPTILRAGYRVLYQDYETDDFTGRNKFKWNVTQQGPVVGLSMRF